MEDSGDVAVMNEETHGHCCILQLPDKRPCQLSDPGIIGARGATGEMDTTRAKFDEEEHIQSPQMDGFNAAEIACQHLLPIVL